MVGRGILARAARETAASAGGRLVAVVSDARVARLVGPGFLRALGDRRAVLLSFPAGERSKTRETKARLEDGLLAAGAGRDTLVVGLGGGVTSDLAGFLAATWHRGVPVVQVPTTLLAMVDAALGGKTGVDLPGGKNLVGAFHHPEALWADVDVLRSLPERHFRSGLAEAVKTAVALDGGLFRDLERESRALLRRDPRPLLALVARCLALKARVVARDAREAGPRAALNFGHTVAHAVEAASDYRVPHGEAVAVGILAEARLAERLLGFPRRDTARIETLLRSLRLPTRLPRGVDPDAVAAMTRRDKKVRAGVVRCALPSALGRMPAGADPTVPADPARDILPVIGPH